MMTLGSLFDGIGGFPLAGTRHGITPVWASEIEPFPIKVTTVRFPDMEHLGDITKIDGGAIEPVDIITFGSPCQDLSVAGKRAGMQHTDKGDEQTTRSGLFMEAVRIIKEMRDATRRNGSVDDVRPRWAVWENVPGAYSSNKGEDFRVVLEELARVCAPSASIPRPARKWLNDGAIMGDGFSIAWRTLDAQYWGVPQRRRRIYLVADFAGGCAPEVLFEREGLRRDIAESGEAREGVATDAKGCADGAIYAIDHVITTGGNCTAQGPCVSDGPMYTLKAGGCYAVSCIPINDQATHINGGCNGSMVGAEGDPMYSLTVTDKHAVALYENHGQDSRLTGPLDISPTVAAKFGTGGNNTPLVGRMVAFGEYADDGTFSTVKARDYKDATDLAVYPSMRVRRLTPLECERLQGFPDGWTDIPGASDSGRYKALGNSLAIPTAEFVIEGIAEAAR
jgi:DNA (cytosine-5)-methyltransferase 1